MSLTKSQINNFRSKGIHMSENIDGNDLRHTFSDFNTVKAKGKTSLKHELNNIPVIGEEASTKGILKLISGS